MIILRSKLCVLRRWTAEQRSTLSHLAYADLADRVPLSHAHTHALSHSPSRRWTAEQRSTAESAAAEIRDLEGGLKRLRDEDRRLRTAQVS